MQRVQTGNINPSDLMMSYEMNYNYKLKHSHGNLVLTL